MDNFILIIFKGTQFIGKAYHYIPLITIFFAYEISVLIIIFRIKSVILNLYESFITNKILHSLLKSQIPSSSFYTNHEGSSV